MPFKEQEKLAMQGTLKIIMKSLGGKGSKLHVDAEETVASVKAKASKKLGRLFSYWLLCLILCILIHHRFKV